MTVAIANAHHRNRSPSTLLMVALLVAFLCAGCDLPGKPQPGSRPEPPSQIMNFETLFAQSCSGCHGADGSLGPAPPLNDPLFVALADDQYLSQVIEQGRRDTPMPAFAADNGGALTREQIDALATGIRKSWAAQDTLPTSPPSLIAASGGTAETGRQLFVAACSGCHGHDGRGIDDGDDTLHALRDPSFLALISDQALRRIIITGRADLGMPNFAEGEGRPQDYKPLTSAEIDDLVALLASWRNAGSVAASGD